MLSAPIYQGGLSNDKCQDVLINVILFQKGNKHMKVKFIPLEFYAKLHKVTKMSPSK